MEDLMCWEIDYKLFAEQTKAREIWSKKGQRADVIHKLLNEANRQDENADVEGMPKEIAPAK